MKLKFESDYRAKLLEISFFDKCVLKNDKDLAPFRSQWLQALSSWHSPYKALIDCRNLELSDEGQLSKGLAALVKFFNGFFLKKIAGFGYHKDLGHDILPFEVFEGYEQARESLGIREKKTVEPSNFRSTIQFDNHFKQHVVELTFSESVTIDSELKLQTLKDKLMNNLMHWHSPWSLIIDCSNVSFTDSSLSAFHKIDRFIKGFHCKSILGYSPSTDKSSYPFKVYRSRHRAAAELESEGNFSGEEANCASRKDPN